MRTPGPATARAARSTAANCPASRTGLRKNEPALLVSGSPGSSTIPLPRRRPRTAERTAASGARPPSGRRARGRARGSAPGADRWSRSSRNGTLSTTNRPVTAAGGRVRLEAALEGAGPVPETAVGAGQVGHGAALTVIYPHRDDPLGDLLAVGADVLDGRRPGPAGDPRQAFHARQPLANAAGHHRIPVLTRRQRQLNRAPAGRGGPPGRPRRPAMRRPTPTRGDAHHGAGEALVGDDEVAAPAEHEQRLTALIGGADPGDDLRLGGRLDQPAGGTAEAQRGVARERRPAHGPGGPVRTVSAMIDVSHARCRS